MTRRAAHRLRDRRGFTFIEVMLVMGLSLVMLGASLTAFERFVRNQRVQDHRFDTSEMARNSLDLQSRQLRNLAKRLNNNLVIDRIESYDLIFQTSDPSRTWVRYCLDAVNAPASAQSARVWQSTMALPASAATSPVTAGMRGTCPGTGWTKQTVVAEDVVNLINGRNQSMFTYTCIDGTTGCVTNSARYDELINVNTQLFVDSTPLKGPGELKVSTTVFLRNQNQAPIARFTTTNSTSPLHTVLFNGSGSTDFENRTLGYYWFKDTMPTSIRCDQPQPAMSGTTRTLWGGTFMGEGVTLTNTFSSGGPRTIALVVCDPGDRYSMTSPTTVNVP
jgi:prepilin-type N-terminal cleavage/methylation domain-containing protein